MRAARCPQGAARRVDRRPVVVNVLDPRGGGGAGGRPRARGGDHRAWVHRGGHVRRHRRAEGDRPRGGGNDRRRRQGDAKDGGRAGSDGQLRERGEIPSPPGPYRPVLFQTTLVLGPIAQHPTYAHSELLCWRRWQRQRSGHRCQIEGEPTCGRHAKE